MNDENYEKILKILTQNSIGLNNVYQEFLKFNDTLKEKDKIHKKEIEKLEDKILNLNIKSYPMNTRIIMKIETNFGEINYTFDYPPIEEESIGNSIQGVFNGLLNKLYEEHEKRGGKFMGDEGCKQWMDENGKTIINETPHLSPRIQSMLNKELNNERI